MENPFENNTWICRTCIVEYALLAQEREDMVLRDGFCINHYLWLVNGRKNNLKVHDHAPYIVIQSKTNVIIPT